jgi:uncharacterized protein
MTIQMKLITMTVFLFVSLPSFAQVRSINLKEALLKEPVIAEKKHFDHYFKQADDELEMAYTGLFYVYKTFISSQDGSTCSFSPSCSEYAVRAVEKFGPIKGGIAFFDRYTRCNSLSPNLYKRDFHKKRLIDDVGEF